MKQEKKENESYDVIVVGAGPAGLSGAISAAEQGARVILLEQMAAPGRKLLATGGGRCNVTNALAVEDMARAFGRQWRFLLPALFYFPPEELRDFFDTRGVPLELTDHFHYFPKSGRAQDILNALLESCRRLGVVIRTGCRVDSLWIDAGQLTGVKTERGRIAAPRVVLATGGKGYPALGATGTGYELARQAGHSIMQPLPAMVGLRTQESWPGLCTGIALPDAEAWIDLPKERQRCRGELLFTHHGISAFAVLDLSGRISELLEKQATVPLRINLFAERQQDDWLAQFDRWQREEGTRTVGKLLARHMPQKLVQHLCPERELTASRFPGESRRKLAEQLSTLKLHINATDGWRKAMVTRGGVALRDIDPETLESRLLPGLCFAGEIVDLDGPCGGYNLQWAFSSGRLTGERL